MQNFLNGFDFSFFVATIVFNLTVVRFSISLLSKIWLVVFATGFVSCKKSSTKNEDPDRVKLHIEFINPAVGKKGTLVNIVGGEFDLNNDKNKVFFNSIPVKVIESYYSSLVVVVPDDPNCSGKVTVTTGNETAVSSENFIYLVPEINEFEPAYAEAGDTIKITGKYFCPEENTNEITLNGIQVPIVQITSNTASVIVPANKNSTGLITLKSCKATAISKTPFTYLPSAQMVTTIAGSPQRGNKDGIGTEALFYGPIDLVLNNNNEIFVTDTWNYSIRKIDQQGLVTTLAGTKIHGHRDGPGNQAQFWMPFGITINHQGQLFVADRDNLSIRKIEPDGFVSTVTRDLLEYPVDVVVIGEYLYFGSANKVYRFKEGEKPVIFVGDGRSGHIDGTGKNALLHGPDMMIAAPRDRLIFADGGNGNIRVINSEGTVSTVLKSDGSRVQASSPTGIAIDQIGNIYFSERDRHLIKRISPNGKVSIVAGNGMPGLKNGNPLQSQFNLPRGIATDNDGNIYVADTHNNSIRKIAME